MKKLVVALLLVLSVSAYGQSETIEDYRQEHKPDNALFFYKSTLRMFARVAADFARNPEDVPTDLTSLIDGINQIKYFMYRYSSDQQEVFSSLKKSITEENYESVISGKFGPNNMEVMMKEKRGKPVAFVVLIIGEEGLQLMDIDGIPDLNKLVEFSQYISSNSDDFSWLNTFRD